VLVSLGGVAGPAVDTRGLAALDRFQFVVPAGAEAGDNLSEVGSRRLAEAGLGYQDLVAAADVAVSKPGYGIVSDCIGGGTRLIYTDRGDFPEYPILVREMTRHLRAVYVTNAVLLRGDLGPALDEILTAPNPAPPDLSGAGRAAERILATAAESGSSNPARPSATGEAGPPATGEARPSATGRVRPPARGKATLD